ncbi:MAG TPA: VOC family protein [Gemmatimonadaceae bacterium]|nr:VOC family protein [Gemmatimonadaceae bacterium]
MRIEHLAIWTRDVDALCAFYARWFEATAGAPYESARRAGFRSRFVTFPDAGARLEVMTLPELAPPAGPLALGITHLAITVGSRAAVETLVERMRAAGVSVRSEPRLTGDGYYEAVVVDPDGNEVEIVA